jgi:hypothetical protein
MTESSTAFLTEMMASGILVVGRHSMARDNGTPEQGARKFPDDNFRLSPTKRRSQEAGQWSYVEWEVKAIVSKYSPFQYIKQV